MAACAPFLDTGVDTIEAELRSHSVSVVSLVPSLEEEEEGPGFRCLRVRLTL